MRRVACSVCRRLRSWVGKPAMFTRPDARIKDAAALWEVLRSTGRLNSLAVVMRPDKTETRVEFLTIRDGDGPGRNVTYLRAID